MKSLILLLDQLCGICGFSKAVLKLGFWCAAGYILLSMGCGLIAPGGDYHQLMALQRDSLESGLTTLAVSVLAALLCDLIYQKGV
ncbi:MAG: hypothetical protein PHD67_06340 [Oscillospiraceae bacterium]|nr:hypothetical protein [Oscillospiraceae bacterium]